MAIRGTVDDSGEEERVFEEPLDGFDEEGREVPGVGKGRSKGSGVLEIRVEGRRFREVVQVFESGWMSRDVFFVRRF